MIMHIRIFFAVRSISIGQNIKVETGEQVFVDCGPLIDDNEDANSKVTWYLDGFQISNGSRLNVIISQDVRLCIITNTLLSDGGELGNGGNYTCEVCSDFSSDRSRCLNGSSTVDVCG